MRSSLFALVLLVSACGATQPALRNPSDVVLSLQDITCQSCGATVTELLEETPGVARVYFDKQKAEVAVHFDAARVLPGDMLRRIKTAGFHVVTGPGQGKYAPATAFPAGSDVQWLARGGTDVDVEAKVVPGKVTVVDFGATWCGPCRDVDKAMLQLLPNEPDVALRKVDVGDWDTPVAKHYLADVPSLPYVLVFSKQGKRLAAIAGLDLPKLLAAIQLAKAQ